MPIWRSPYMTHITTWDDGTRRIEPTWVQNASYCCRFLDGLWRVDGRWSVWDGGASGVGVGWPWWVGGWWQSKAFVSADDPESYVVETASDCLEARCQEGPQKSFNETTQTMQLNVGRLKEWHADPDPTEGQTGEDDSPNNDQRNNEDDRQQPIAPQLRCPVDLQQQTNRQQSVSA